VSILILLRHDESVWNRDDRFAGWADVDLTRTGADQAREAGRRLRAAGIAPDVGDTLRALLYHLDGHTPESIARDPTRHPERLPPRRAAPAHRTKDAVGVSGLGQPVRRRLSEL
jgi:2,3-bisphosphoglycerate-dependent phosphoglycerate mutase